MAYDPIRAEELMEHAPFLRRVASGILHRSDLAEDAVQQTMIAALDREPQKRHRLRAWLAGIARRKAIDILRHEVRLGRREERVATPESWTDGAAGVETEETRRNLARAVLELDEPYRTTLLLRYYEGLGPTELAARQGTPVETVRTRSRRGLALLREKFANGDDRVAPAILLPLLALRETRRPAGAGAAAKAGPPGRSPSPAAARGGRFAGFRVAAGLLLAAGLAIVLFVTGPGGPTPAPSRPGEVDPTAEAGPLPGRGGREVAAAASAPDTPVGTPDRATSALSGRVTEDGTGRPLADATVRVEIYRDAPDGTTLVTRRARTDADGRYAFPELAPGLGFLSVAANGFFLARDRHPAPDGFFPGQSLTPDLVVWLDGESKGAVRDFAMRRGYRVAGVVLGPGGGPVGGAQVEAVQRSPDAVPYPWNKLPRESTGPLATTDGEGRFEIDGLPPRADWAFYAVKDGLRSRWSPSLALGPGRPDGEVRLVLGPGAARSGVVVADDGSPVAGAEVSASGRTSVERGGPATATTDARGRFSLTGLPVDDPLTLLVLADGRPRHTVPLGALAEGTDLPPLEVSLPAGETLTGRLRGSNGKPRAGVVLQLARLPGAPGGVQATTTGDGTFAFRGLPRGRGRIGVLEEGWRAGPELGTVEVPGPPLDFVYDPPRTTSIRVRVNGPEGRPVPICRVRAKARSNEGVVMERIAERFVAGGEATFTAVAGAIVDFRVFAASDAAGRSLGLRTGVLRATAGREDAVTVRLEAGRCLSGHVRDGEGRAIPGAVLSLGDAMAVADEEGRFRIGAVPDGQASLLVRPPRGFFGPASVPIPDGDEPIEIVLQRGISVSGTARYADGALVRSGIVQAVWLADGGGSGRTQGVVRPNGCFLLAGVPRQASLDLLVNAPEAAEHESLAPWHTTVPAVETLDLTLPTGVLIEGRILDSKGGPLAAGWVDAVRNREATRGNVGPEGTFRLVVPAAGDWTLTVRPLVPGEKPWSAVVTAPATNVSLAPPD